MGRRFRDSLHGGGGLQVGEVTRLSIKSLILIWSLLHDRWGHPPRVTSPVWGPTPPCKQALRNNPGVSGFIRRWSDQRRGNPLKTFDLKLPNFVCIVHGSLEWCWPGIFKNERGKGHLKDGVFLLLRPEFISFSVLSYLNLVMAVRIK